MNHVTGSFSPVHSDGGCGTGGFTFSYLQNMSVQPFGLVNFSGMPFYIWHFLYFSSIILSSHIVFVPHSPSCLIPTPKILALQRFWYVTPFSPQIGFHSFGHMFIGLQ